VLETEVILDDAVVDHDDASGAVTVWMRVLLGRASVRRPARVADAVLAVDGIGRDDLLELRQFAGAAAQLDRPVAHDRDAGRVVPPVLEAPEAVDEDGHELFGSDVADDSAHNLVLPLFARD